MNTDLVKVDERQERRILSITEQVKNLSITCQADKQRAVDLFRDVKQTKLDVECLYTPHIDRAKQLASGLTSDMKQRIDPLEEGMEIIKNKINESDEGWHVEGEYKRKYVEIKVIDEAAVPREYLMLDMKRITNVANALGEDTNIPGIEVKAIEKTVIRME